MHSIRQILDAFTDAHGESLQLGYDQGEGDWNALPTLAGSDLPW